VVFPFLSLAALRSFRWSQQWGWAPPQKKRTIASLSLSVNRVLLRASGRRKLGLLGLWQLCARITDLSFTPSLILTTQVNSPGGMTRLALGEFLPTVRCPMGEHSAVQRVSETRLDRVAAQLEYCVPGLCDFQRVPSIIVLYNAPQYSNVLHGLCSLPVAV
jgi:hypothetical protein